MNKGKRGLELASAIISIIMGGILAFGSLILLSSIEVYEEILGVEFQGLEIILKISMVIVLAFALAIIILGAILCTSPIKNGQIKSRMGVSISLIVLLSLLMLMELSSSLFYAILFAIPCGLLIGSICMKHNKKIIVNDDKETDDDFEKSVLDAEQKIIVDVNANENNDSVEAIESQLLKLKELKDKEVISEEQYKEAVNKILNKL